MLAGLTWPCTLSPGWSVGWDGSSAGADASPSEWCLVRALSRCQAFVSYHVLFPLNKWTLMTLVVELLQYFYAQNWFVIIFKFLCNILWCMKCVLLYSLDSPSCEFLLIWSCFLRGFNREFTRGTAKDCASWIRVALQQWLAHLIHFCWGGSATDSTSQLLHESRALCNNMDKARVLLTLGALLRNLPRLEGCTQLVHPGVHPVGKVEPFELDEHQETSLRSSDPWCSGLDGVRSRYLPAEWT